MKIIALDSSGLVATVAIVEDESLIAEYNVQYKKTHSQTLLPMLDELKKMTELDLSTVDAIAIASGPGSFTGLRIGSSTAKGLAQALDIPIIEIPTLLGMACNLCGTDALICPIMDARRQQVYTAVYKSRETDSENGRFSYSFDTLLEQCAIGIEELTELLNEYLTERVIFLGDGVPVFREYIDNSLKIKHTYAPAHLNRQRAAAFAYLAMDYFKEGKYVSCFEHKPEYLRPSQAERERAEGIKIREMTKDDVDAASALETRTFSMPWKSEDFLEMVNAPYAHYYVASEGDAIVGICGMRELSGEGEITNVAVDKSLRRNGIATRLLTEALKKSESLGIKNMTLEVRALNKPAIALYEKLGFKGEGVRPDFYESPKEDALIMWRRIEKIC